ncbi:hypothetical protein [Natribacillus halophilus]|uniref:Uncharacterized protein n=1 Tax=Natribacillus halophilus TaxID=549003 RepID=A0A1G8NM36_9BACI|nr:hypothetical protein [Natribacillus halophilus]SDI80570.1 hypothetical protein SAMN04488123_106124 [Natribacillus halophilus]
MMAEECSQTLVKEFEEALHRPLTEEETDFLAWVGGEHERSAVRYDACSETMTS